MSGLKLEFAELIFPSLLFGVYLNARQDRDDQPLRDVGNALQQALLADARVDVEPLRMALDVLEYFRLFRLRVLRSKEGVKSKLWEEVLAWKTCFWFEIPYVVVAEAALRCGAYLTALMYMEMRFDDRDKDSSTLAITRGTSKFFDTSLHVPGSSSSPAAGGAGGGRVSSVMGHWDKDQQVLLAAYRQVEEPDGLIAFNKRADFHAHAITWEQGGEWVKALGYFDTLLANSSAPAIESAGEVRRSDGGEAGLFSSLRDVGYASLCLLAAQHLANNKQPGSSEAVLEAAWRAEDWNIDLGVDGGEQYDAQPGFNSSLYRSLRELHQVLSSGGARVRHGLDSVLKHVTLARTRAVHDMFSQNLQSTKQSQSMLARFQLCEDVHEFAKLLLDRDAPQEPTPSKAKVGAFQAPGGAVDRLVDKWKCRAKTQDFSLCEPASCLQRVLLGLAKCESKLVEHLCLAAKAASNSGNLSYARCAMHRLQLRGSRDGQVTLGPGAWCLRAAKLMWLDGQRDKAVGLLRQLASFLSAKEGRSQQETRLLSRALAANASWLSISRSEGWREIEKMLKESVRLLDETSSHSGRNAAALQETNQARAKAHFKLASFMDTMYSREQDDVEELSSKQADQQLQATLAALRRVTGPEAKPLKEREFRLRTHLREQEERQKLKRAFVIDALKHYMLCTVYSTNGRYQSVVFRILHLWFENSNIDAVNNAMCEAMEVAGPSKAFLIVARQAVSRLEQEQSTFQTAIRSLLLALLQKHPHDMLYHIIAASNEIRGARTTGGTSSKVQAAQGLLQQYKGSGSTQNKLVTQTKELVDAYIELADIRPDPTKEKPKAGSDYTSGLTKLRRIRWNANEGRVRMPTLGEGATGDGSPDQLVSRFGEKWTYPGGITIPKKITCFSTDGRAFTQVVKGGEDPRSDAVSSQLFSVLGILLRGDVACRQRQLDIGTYKVIPLDPTSGLIEWVDNAASLGVVLGASMDPNQPSLRAKYNPTGMAHKDSRTKMDAQRKKPVEEKAAALGEIWKKTRPVFRHFFLERSESAQEWFSMRLAYTRSVAASSMAGFIVGLGDRHTGNILIREDRERCGQLVHIDLGMVFDQGKLLPIPEKVPFRLTREMLDGMGVAQTEGVMTRCCEETLRVMRENKQALLAIVDVLLHDPLASWKETSSKKAAAQGFEAEDGCSPDAKLVRRSVQDRLDGWDRGETLGVEGQVKQLIRDATSVENLSSLFCGWAAWL